MALRSIVLDDLSSDMNVVRQQNAEEESSPVGGFSGASKY